MEAIELLTSNRMSVNINEMAMVVYFTAGLLIMDKEWDMVWGEMTI